MNTPAHPALARVGELRVYHDAATGAERMGYLLSSADVIALTETITADLIRNMPKPIAANENGVAHVIFIALGIARDADLARLTNADGTTKPDHLVAGTTWSKAMAIVAAFRRRAALHPEETP